MNTRQVLFIGSISILAGAIAGLITSNWAAWIGTTFIAFALLYASAPWFIRRFSRDRRRIDAEAREVAKEAADRRTAFGFNPEMDDEPLNASSREDAMVRTFMSEFSIDETKARSLIDAGYKRIGDFNEAIPDDLMLVNGINPTIAKRIVSRIHDRRMGKV
ncbi:MAG: helix-hairpin-helix domain-containing protein [Candidatus Thermoplasmatota archaeon]|nr:helix-hairpin-helix domain-containing protein [Candidatus Thermoplasmatota archaeon]